MDHFKVLSSMRLIFISIMFGIIVACFDGANAQFLRNLLSNSEDQDNSGNRDDLPEYWRI